MFQEHFQLKQQPFSEHAAPEALWMHSRMKEATARIEYFIAHGNLGLITGPSGVGKSALLKRSMSNLPKSCEAVYCHLTHMPSAAFLKIIVTGLGEEPRRGKDRLFGQIYQAAERTEGTLLLVIDEAHLLDATALTDLRLLVSSATDVAPQMKILLVGQHSLRTTLKKSQHADLLNRINVHYQLRALTSDETSNYIDIQIKQAGGPEDVFDADVKGMLHDYCGGIPRQINNLATACLLQAAAKNTSKVDEQLFRQVTKDFHLN